MIAEVSFKNDEVRKKINELVGKPFSFLKRLQLKGTGSSRMIIKEWSKQFDNYFTHTEKIKYANIELRPKGILVHWNKNYTHFAWVIPYYKLSIYKNKLLSIHADGLNLKMAKESINLSNSAFIQKLLSLKLKMLNSES